MKISTIETGFLKLDGGAMFGIVPKRLWQKLNPPDENNLCTWAMRCLLVETDNRKILIDTGIGDKQDEKFRSHFEPHGDKTLVNSLLEKNLHPEDITDVLLTHLHFDHVGGAVKFDSNGKLVPTFPNATYWSNEIHWNWAMNPNEREKASFLKENFVPLREAGVIQFIDVQEEDLEWLPGIHLRFVYGHTEAMMIPIIKIANKTLIYCADVMPSSYHIGMPYVMSYDVRPLVTLVEKEKILYEAVTNKNILLFEHDPFIPAATVTQDDRGRIILEKTFNNLEQALLSI
ncbi:MAG: MBL fold metallo-hydrolase [Saprospiraceae bacterium]|nr:MBL fold metallo-hydrolase [Saprospiraceae bacterium]